MLQPFPVAMFPHVLESATCHAALWVVSGIKEIDSDPFKVNTVHLIQKVLSWIHRQVGVQIQ